MSESTSKPQIEQLRIALRLRLNLRREPQYAVEPNVLPQTVSARPPDVEGGS